MDKYAIIIYWSNEDQLYIAEAPELPGCVTHGETQLAALANATEAIQLWVNTAKEFGNRIPEPIGQRPSIDLIEPKTRRVNMTANTRDPVKYGITRSGQRSSGRRNKSRVFSSLKAPQSTTNPKAH